MKQATLDKMAKSMVRISKKAIKECEKWEGDEDMIQMFQDDAEDYLNISTLIKRGDLQEAARYAADLDTAARDEIASYVYDTLLKHY